MAQSSGLENSLICESGEKVKPALTTVSIVPQSERPPVKFLVRAHAWVAGSVPGQGASEKQSVNFSLSH